MLPTSTGATTMTIKTTVKAGGMRLSNHNETLRG